MELLFFRGVTQTQGHAEVVVELIDVVGEQRYRFSILLVIVKLTTTSCQSADIGWRHAQDGLPRRNHTSQLGVGHSRVQRVHRKRGVGQGQGWAQEAADIGLVVGASTETNCRVDGFFGIDGTNQPIQLAQRTCIAEFLGEVIKLSAGALRLQAIDNVCTAIVRVSPCRSLPVALRCDRSELAEADIPIHFKADTCIFNVLVVSAVCARKIAVEVTAGLQRVWRDLV